MPCMIETLYIITPGISIRQAGGLLILEQNHKVIRTLPIATVGNLVLGRTVQISTQVMFSLIKQGTLIQFVDYKYNVIGTLGDNHTILPRLLWQAKYFQDNCIALAGAKYIVHRKIKAQIAILDQYKKTRKIPMYTSVRSTLYTLLKRIKQAKTIEGVRGIEGLASKTYFSVWETILSEPWEFTGRNRNPSLDPVNTLLSYGYSFLEREVRACLVTAGLDVRIGVLHSTNNRKDSFVFDMMDLFRQAVMDRFILKVLNCHMLKFNDFDISENGCFMSKSSTKKWIQIYEDYMTTPKKHFGALSPRRWIQREITNFIKYLTDISDDSITLDTDAKCIS